MEALQTILQSITPIEEAAFEAIMVQATFKTYSAGTFIASPDKTCRHIGFLKEGIVRVYHLHEGKEITDYFNTLQRNPFVASFASFLQQQPSREYVETLTACELLEISYDHLQQLYSQFPSMERLGRILAEKNYLLALERIESLQYHNATERYEAFLQQYPLLVNQIPHHYIASYLGVTPESLSRIRKSLVR